jgi:ABC-type branched-subunit amino acid transport system permease subunit
MFSPPRFVSRIRESALCERDTSIATAWQALGWWEARRAAFNLIVGSAGIISFVVIGIVGLGSYFLFDSDLGGPESGLPILAIPVYAVMANICYTGGWVAESVIRKRWPEQADRFATLSLALGIAFSVLLTLSPAVIVGAAGLFGLIGHLLGVVHSVHN